MGTLVDTDRVGRLVLLDWQEDEPSPVLDALMPLGLPPAAILVLRRLAVVAAPANVPGAVVAEVADASRRAARPLRGEVDAGAEVVLFADEAELLACYLVATHTGRLGGWVWAQLAGMLPPPVVDAIVGDPSARLAGVVAALDEWRRAADVLAALSPSGRIALLHGLVEQHDLWIRAVRAPAAPVLDESAAGRPAGQLSDASPAAYDVGRRGSTTALATVTTGPAFAASVVSLVARLLGRSEQEAVGPTSAHLGRVLHASEDDAVFVRSGVDAESTPVDRGRVDQPAVVRDDRARPAERREDPVARPRSDTPIPAEVPPGPEDAAEAVATALAGAFYLVNAYRRLDVRALDLVDAAPWDVIDGLARAVVPVDLHVDDPVWLAFQALAGRSPGEPPAPDVLTRCVTAMVHVLDDLALEPAEPTLAELVVVPGRLVVNRTHVEVRLALDAVDLAVRRRALDADPGWVPSLGRVIRFHFVEGAAR